MELPFAALHQLCASMLDRLDTLPDPQRDAASTAFGLTTGTSPDRLLIGLAVLNLLSCASDDSPLLCVVDDAQWLDRESAQALAFVARRLLAERVGLVFATRQPNADLAAFPSWSSKDSTTGDAQTLLSAVLHVPLDERVRDRIVAETHGNPLALVEWPRGLTRAELAGGFGMPASLPMSGQIEESFRRRLAELPAPTQRFLTVAAAEPTGDPVIVWRAASSLGVGPRRRGAGDRRRDSSRSVSACGSGIRWCDRRRTELLRSRIGRPRIGRSRTRPIPTSIPIGGRGTARSAHRAPTKTIAEALERSAGRARGPRRTRRRGARCSSARSPLTVDPSRRAERVLAAAAAHLEAGSFELAAGLLATGGDDAARRDGPSRGRLRRAPAGRLSAATHGPRPELLLRAARSVSNRSMSASRRPLYLAGDRRGVLAREPEPATRHRATSHAPRTRVPRRPRRPRTEWLVAGLVQVTIDGPGRRRAGVATSVGATADRHVRAHRNSTGSGINAARRPCCGTATASTGSRRCTSPRRASSARSRCCRAR